MQKALLILFIFGIQHVFGQSDNYNFGFEKPTKTETIPNWQKKNEGVAIALDSITKYQGNYSLKISSNNKSNGIPGVQNIINKSFEGKEIELNCYLKTENVQSAYIFLIIGTEKQNQFSFDMSPIVSGTSDWKKLSVKIPYTSESTKITIACNIEGSGEVWLDNLSLKIDNTNINELKTIKQSSVFDSKFALNELSEKEVNKLQLLGKLWGS